MLSRWPILLEFPVTAADIEIDGRLTEEAAGQFFATGRAALFAECRTFDAGSVDIVEAVAARRLAVAGDQVTLSVSVTELFPDRFVMTGRIRSAGSDAVVADLRCAVSAGPVTDEVRDELIAIAHGARHWH